jgi:hypothetical protein
VPPHSTISPQLYTTGPHIRLRIGALAFEILLAIRSGGEQRLHRSKPYSGVGRVFGSAQLDQPVPGNVAR